MEFRQGNNHEVNAILSYATTESATRHSWSSGEKCKNDTQRAMQLSHGSHQISHKSSLGQPPTEGKPRLLSTNQSTPHGCLQLTSRSWGTRAAVSARLLCAFTTRDRLSQPGREFHATHNACASFLNNRWALPASTTQRSYRPRFPCTQSPFALWPHQHLLPI
ncbi:hypothetical protein TIFTF001_025507 [Ficus carica]|uniref:Uncharacterized protein n=1 Tax=Ficus carica TaxID=3494 RepID=A0AA88DGN8_FICCA|nr:hypothetical protein TIFTF001_025507 [Ficus carica]